MCGLHRFFGENQEFVFGLIKFEIRCLSGKNQVSIGNANWALEERTILEI